MKNRTAAKDSMLLTVSTTLFVKEICRSLKNLGIISLIPKKNESLELLKNWRPIS